MSTSGPSSSHQLARPSTFKFFCFQMFESCNVGVYCVLLPLSAVSICYALYYTCMIPSACRSNSRTTDIRPMLLYTCLITYMIACVRFSGSQLLLCTLLVGGLNVLCVRGYVSTPGWIGAFLVQKRRPMWCVVRIYQVLIVRSTAVLVSVHKSSLGTSELSRSQR